MDVGFGECFESNLTRKFVVVSLAFNHFGQQFCFCRMKLDLGNSFLKNTFVLFSLKDKHAD